MGRSPGLLLFAVGALCAGCSDGVEITMSIVSAATEANALQVEGSPHLHTSFAGGQNLAEGLSSLKYYIVSIDICEDLTTNGTGYSNEKNCATIYSGPSNTAYSSNTAAFPTNAQYIQFANAARASNDGFIDLIDPQTRAKLNSSAHVPAGKYNYGKINWGYPIKVTATVPLSDGRTLYTHDGTSTEVSVGNGTGIKTVTSTALTTGPATEAVVVLPNGGTWFKFQSPFVVETKNTPDLKPIQLDLAFNPAGLIHGGTNGSVGPADIVDGNDQNAMGIGVPMLDLTPIPHKSGAKVRKETYTAPFATEGVIRFELYSVDDDADTAIYGATVNTLVSSSSTGMVMISKVAFMTAANDGSLTFERYDHQPIFTGFKRQTTVGGTTNVTLTCDSGAALTAACTASSTQAVTFTLVAVDTL